MSGLTLHIGKLSVDSRRKMSGVAYAGGVLSYYGDNIAIDLDTLQFSGKQIPLLHNHDRDRHVGYGWLSREGSKLMVNGEMLDNDYAKEIIAAADGGLEWQMSVHIESDRVITRHAGDTVNGIPLEVDDVMLFANGVIREVSFTPTGVDADTKASILSLSIKEADMPKPQETNDNTVGVQLSQAHERIAKLSADIETKDKRIAELEKQISDERTAARLSQLKDLGVDGERAAKLSKADHDTYEALVEQIKLTATKNAVLSADYSGGEAAEQKRPNPLLKGVNNA